MGDGGMHLADGCKGDLLLLRPTLMAAVPLIVDRMRDRAFEKVRRREGGRVEGNVYTPPTALNRFSINRGFLINHGNHMLRL